MTDFRTPVNISPAPFQIGHQDRIFLSGSCFTTHIGSQLYRAKFQTLTNPLGVIYNPASIAKGLEIDPRFETSDFFENEGRWRHWDFHSEMAQTDAESAALLASKTASEIQNFLKKTNTLVITLGTASVFSLASTGQIVANCHKMPMSLFAKSRLSVEQTVTYLQRAFDHVRTLQPTIKIVLTVSPVRHLREGAVENQRSKAVLLLACEMLAATNHDIYYFPAYELLLDDLRDYRFYGPDMLHPSDTAVQYIWKNFAEVFFSAETRALITRIEKVKVAAQHRPFNMQSSQHRAFVAKQLAIIGELEQEYPVLNFDHEKKALSDTANPPL